MRKKTTISTDLLKALNYSSAEDAALDMILLSARSKYAEFSQEVKRFEQKYQMDFETFQKLVENQTNGEDFEPEEDLMAWKFVTDAAEYWRQKIEELRRFAGFGEMVP